MRDLGAAVRERFAAAGAAGSLSAFFVRARFGRASSCAIHPPIDEAGRPSLETADRTGIPEAPDGVKPEALYPLDEGGRPPHMPLPFTIITVEMGFLFGALAVVVAEVCSA